MVVASEREALDRLLASGVFAKSPNLEKILVYLCRKHFEGDAHYIKEYHIATEALGRPESFDPKKDSIVRVEMHRLRKRLREYYDAAPVETVRIEIPEKSYIPEFRLDKAPQVLEALAEPVPPEALSPQSAGRRATMAVVSLAAVSGGAWWYARTPDAGEGPAPPANRRLPAEPAIQPVQSDDIIRIMTGRPPGRFTDRFGQVWQGDRYYSGGTSVAVNADVASRGFDINLFASMRTGDFEYEIPLKPGVYELLLIFAETEYGERNPLGGGETSRVFTISANGKKLIESFEAIADASESNTATARRFRDLSPAADGKLHLRFGPASTGRPFLNAIEIRPGIAGGLRPVRMVCRPEPYRDPNGNDWEPEHFYRGGKQISRPQGAPGPDGELMRGERYGNFSYEIPVPPGRYGARLYFWDYWWGPGHPGAGGAGSRVFDVFGNHKPLLVNFDIIRDNPRDQVAVRTFHGFEPNPRGKIVLDFVSKVNYAQLNAIEIFEESR